MPKNDLSKEILYQSVKTLLDATPPHIHLRQQKLFTLFSFAFQYLLFCSTKNPGAYLLRIEDGVLAEKLSHKARDPVTRKFLKSLSLSRKLRYKKSTFFIDFFHFDSWFSPKILPLQKVQAALIVKNASPKPLEEWNSHQYLTSLLDVVPKTITIAHDCSIEGLASLEFPFVKKAKIQGLTVSKDLDIDSFD